MPGMLFRQVDCIQVPVPDLEKGLAFYRDRLGHPLKWRTATAAGLGMQGSEAEIVLQTERPRLEPNLLVESADEAAERFLAAGGRVIRGPFDVQVGRCVVVADPFGNVLVLLDLSKGLLATDEQGNVTGNQPAS